MTLISDIYTNNFPFCPAMSKNSYMHEWDSEYQLPFCEIYSQSNMIECEIIMEKKEKPLKAFFHLTLHEEIMHQSAK